MESPTETLQHLLPEAITVACGSTAVVRRTVAFDRKEVASRARWILDGKVNPESC
jgi:hypothetical protein